MVFTYTSFSQILLSLPVNEKLPINIQNHTVLNFLVEIEEEHIRYSSMLYQLSKFELIPKLKITFLNPVFQMINGVPDHRK